MIIHEVSAAPQLHAASPPWLIQLLRQLSLAFHTPLELFVASVWGCANSLVSAVLLPLPRATDAWSRFYNDLYSQTIFSVGVARACLLLYACAYAFAGICAFSAAEKCCWTKKKKKSVGLFGEIGRPQLWLQTLWLYVQHRHLAQEVVLSRGSKGGSRDKATSQTTRHESNT